MWAGLWSRDNCTLSVAHLLIGCTLPHCLYMYITAVTTPAREKMARKNYCFWLLDLKISSCYQLTRLYRAYRHGKGQKIRYIRRMSGVIRFTIYLFVLLNQEAFRKKMWHLSWWLVIFNIDIDTTTPTSYDEEKILTLMWCEDPRPVSPLLENTNLVSALTLEPTQCGAWCQCTVKMPDKTGYTGRTLLIIANSMYGNILIFSL